MSNWGNYCIILIVFIITERLINYNHLAGGFNILSGGILLKNIQIAIDGPAGAGKSTIAKKIATELNITYIDTGAMYRAIAYKTIVKNVDILNEHEIIKLAENTDIAYIEGELFLDKRHVDKQLRCQEVNAKVSYVARIPEVRKILVNLQRKIASGNSIVMDGRDIGTFVLPNADVKIYLTASLDERVYRRYLELTNGNQKINLEDIKQSIIERDKIDTEREYAPLIKAEDATVIDTTGLTIDQVVEKIIKLIKSI